MKFDDLRVGMVVWDSIDRWYYTADERVGTVIEVDVDRCTRLPRRGVLVGWNGKRRRASWMAAYSLQLYLPDPSWLIGQRVRVCGDPSRIGHIGRINRETWKAWVDWEHPWRGSWCSLRNLERIGEDGRLVAASSVYSGEPPVVLEMGVDADAIDEAAFKMAHVVFAMKAGALTREQVLEQFERIYDEVIDPKRPERSDDV